MSTTYKNKLYDDINAIPEEVMPRLYRIIHTLCAEFALHTATTKTRGSLKGLWGNVNIDESLITEAKRSLFTYEREIEK